MIGELCLWSGRAIFICEVIVVGATAAFVELHLQFFKELKKEIKMIVSEFRQSLPQVLAVSIKNIILIGESVEIAAIKSSKQLNIFY